jgi:ABC-2 type transport system permease protein
MNRILFRMEFRRNLRSLVIWSVVISLLVFFTMSFFRTVLQYQQQIAGMVQMIPAAAIKMRGFGNINDMFSVMGFYTANNMMYMMLLGSIYAIVLSSNILLKEEYGKTAEFLMSRPVTRSEIYVSKLGLACWNIFLLNLLVALVSLVSILIFKTGKFTLWPFFVLTVYTLLLNLLFGSMGIFISVLMKRARPVTFFTVGLVLVFYFIFSISRMTGVNGSFGYISPFKWVNIEVLSPTYGMEPGSLAFFMCFMIFFTFTAGFLYRRKDILT